MPRVYRSPVKEASRKAPLESLCPHPPYQPLHAAEDATVEEARHTAAEEVAQANIPRQTEPDIPGDTHTPPGTDNPAEIQAAPNTPAPHTPAPDNVAHVGTVAGP